MVSVVKRGVGRFDVGNYYIIVGYEGDLDLDPTSN